MNYESQLEFVQKLLEGYHITSHIIENPTIGITNTIDLGLRSMIYNENDYSSLLQNSMNQAKHNTVYRFYDEYFCNYVFFRLPNKVDSYFFIGPYLLEIPSETLIKQKIENLGLSNNAFMQLRKYYANLPVIEDENLIFTITNTLGIYLWNSNENFVCEYVDYAIPDRIHPIITEHLEQAQIESPFYLKIIEENYENEKKLTEAVSQGKYHLVNTIASTVFSKGTEQRLTDTIRNRKNYLIILNTLLRKAAEQGDVHPLHIDRLSSSYAKKIESIKTINDSYNLLTEMIRNYCLLVKKHSLTQYSYLIGKTLTIISFDLSADLSLKSISNQLNVNPSYLSNLFKKECGCTLTDYVTNKRIEYAVNLLDSTDKQIQTIAFECGIQDTNYFIKLFKKQTGLTPSKYRQNFQKK